MKDVQNPMRPCLGCAVPYQNHDLTSCPGYEPGPYLHKITESETIFKSLWEGRRQFIIVNGGSQEDLREGDPIEIKVWKPSGISPGGVRARAGFVARGDKFGLPPGVVVVQLAPPEAQEKEHKHVRYDEGRS